jgi:uncharacterized protein YfiM (DUF2279 family)
MINKCIYGFIIIYLYANTFVNAQHDTIINCRKKQLVYVSSIGSVYIAGMAGLYHVWYKDYPKSKFHLFNDADEWLLMDKAGHLFSAYTLARYADAGMRKFTCLDNKQSVIWGLSQSMIFLTTLEIFDGFSAQWGFSWPDMAFNILGLSLYGSQELFLKKQLLIPKFSVSLSPYSKYRPEILGNSFAERILKDYNGQSYWLSFSPFVFFGKNKTISNYTFVCISIGYGAEGLLGGKNNPETNSQGNTLPYFNRYRKILCSLDIDFSKIKTRKKWLKTVFNTINIIKIPFPALEFSQGKTKIHGLYF